MRSELVLSPVFRKVEMPSIDVDRHPHRHEGRNAVVRFIHTSDWQLGMTRHYLDSDAQPRFTGDRVETVRRIMSLAVERGCAFVVVAGDVFEHPNLGAKDIGRALEAMGSQEVPLFLLPGNHDPLGTGSIWNSPTLRDRLPGNVTVLDRAGAWPVSPGVEILAAPWTSKRPDTDPVTGVLDGVEADGTVRVLVGHGMLEELEPDAASPVTVHRAPLDAALADGRIHYAALGDRHIRWPLSEDSSIRYSGAHESTSFREPGQGHVLEVEIPDDGGKPLVTAVPVGQWQHVVLRHRVDGYQDIQALAERLDQLRPKERTVVKTALAGSLTVTERAALDDVLETRAPLFAALLEWDRHTDLVVQPDSQELGDLDVSGYVREAVDQLLALSGSASSGPPDSSGTAEGAAPVADADLPDETALGEAADDVEDDLLRLHEPSTEEAAQDALRLLVRFTGGA